MKDIIIRDNEHYNGIVVAKGWRTAGATLTRIISKGNLRGWMLDMERNIRRGEAVAIDDLFAVVNLAHKSRLTPKQMELKEAAREYYFSFPFCHKE